MISIIQKVIEYGLIKDKANYKLWNVGQTDGDVVRCDDVLVRIFRANHNKRTVASGFSNEINTPLSELVNSINVDLAYMPTKMESGHRKISNYLGCENMIALDVDSGCSILQARMIFEHFAHAIITTKKHLALIDGVQYGERFRVFLPLKTETPKDNDKRAELVVRLFEMIGSVVDKNTKDSSRFFHSSLYDSKSYLNDGVLFDWEALMDAEQITTKEAPKPTQLPIPNQEFTTKRWNGRMIRVLVNGGNEEYSGELDEEAHLRGIEIFLENEYYAGQKSNTLFKAASMLKGDGLDDDFIADYLINYWQSKACSTDRMRDAMSNIRGGLKV